MIRQLQWLLLWVVIAFLIAQCLSSCAAPQRKPFNERTLYEEFVRQGIIEP
jgi:hypothetical protein